MLHEDFQAFCDPEQAVLSILQCYFLSLQSCMVPIFQREWIGHPRTERKEPTEKGDDNAFLQLSRAIDSSLVHMTDQRLRQYLDWPLHIQSLLQQEALFNANLLDTKDGIEIVYVAEEWFVKREDMSV